MRDKFRGVSGGMARIAWKCSKVRGRTQPINEMKSKIYIALNHGDE
jgi:hypothetical protein